MGDETYLLPPIGSFVLKTPLSKTVLITVVRPPGRVEVYTLVVSTTDECLGKPVGESVVPSVVVVGTQLGSKLEPGSEVLENVGSEAVDNEARSRLVRSDGGSVELSGFQPVGEEVDDAREASVVVIEEGMDEAEIVLDVYEPEENRAVGDVGDVGEVVCMALDGEDENKEVLTVDVAVICGVGEFVCVDLDGAWPVMPCLVDTAALEGSALLGKDVEKAVVTDDVVDRGVTVRSDAPDEVGTEKVED